MSYSHTIAAQPGTQSYFESSPPSSPSCFSSGATTPASPVFSDCSSDPSSSGLSTPDGEIYESQLLSAFAPFPRDDYVLVVGGLGYIGSHTVWELLKAGHNVVVVDNLSNSYRDVLQRVQHLVKDHYKNSMHIPQLDFHEVDYRDSSTMRSILDRYAKRPTLRRTLSDSSASPDTAPTGPSLITSVIHFAAYKAVEESVYHPLKYYSNNVAGLIDFCTLLNTFCIKTLVFSSSATVYGELANQGGRLREELCTHATTQWIDAAGTPQTTLSGCTGLTNPYGRTKWMSEAILSDLATSDAAWKIYALRYFNPIGCDSSGVLGEDPRGTPNNLMPIVIRAMEGRMAELSIFGADWDTADGTAIRDFIHVSDLARGHVAAIQAGIKKDACGGFQAINLGTGNGSSVREVVDTMAEISGKDIRTRVAERRVGDVGVCIADPSKAEEMLGWTPEKTLEDSCRDICNYLRAHA
jgi:UDP-glucose 4-epimerase